MFKRVEKRRRRKEKEEKLGIDESMKELLGFHDSDSDESESESDNDSSSSDDDPKAQVNAISSLSENMAEEESDEEGMDKDDGEASVEEDPALSVQDALRDPIYLLSVHSEVKACIVCPGKHLKDTKMTESHRTSNAHNRRIKKFAKAAESASPADSAWELEKQLAEQSPFATITSTSTSKRAQKRMEARAKRKARRQELKVKTRAKRDKEAQVAQTSIPKSGEKQTKNVKSITKNDVPAKKRRKLSEAELTTAGSVPPTTKTTTKTKSTAIPLSAGKMPGIIRSAQSRAKAARSRALSNTNRKMRKD